MYRCESCGKVFDTPGQRDEGIGHYEFWGSCGCDVQMVNCCPECGDDYEEVTEMFFCHECEELGSDEVCQACGNELTEALWVNENMERFENEE